MADIAKQQDELDTPKDVDRGSTTEPAGNDTTMKDNAHKEQVPEASPIPGDPGPNKGKPPPEGTGESTGRRGEDVHRQDGREFEELGQTPVGRPYGTNHPETVGVDGKKNISEDMPDVQAP